VIEVAMSQEDKVETAWVDLVVPGYGIVARMLGVQPRVEGKTKGPDLTIGTICPDSTVGIKVGKLHEVEGGGRGIYGDFQTKWIHADMYFISLLIDSVKRPTGLCG
jgi:hypothetical protein